MQNTPDRVDLRTGFSQLVGSRGCYVGGIRRVDQEIGRVTASNATIQEKVAYVMRAKQSETTHVGGC
jgi:hypothetical protein